MIKPINKNILIHLAETTDVSKGGIILKTAKREQKGKVLAVGNEVKYIKPGMEIAFQHGDFKIVEKDEGGEYAIVNEDHVVGFFET